MYAGVSGLKAHQQQMDVIGNNISNVNTTGFKGSRVTFKEMLSQTINGASSPQGGRGGTNPKQIGLGVQLGSIDKNMGQGSLQSTGKETDVALQGNGFFIVNDGNQNRYTRAGNMTFDKDGYLVNSANGNRVQGWVAAEDGTIDQTNMDNLEDISLDQSMDASASGEIILEGNLDASASQKVVSTSIYDSLGFEHDISLTMNKTADNEWTVDPANINITGSSAINSPSSAQTIEFDGTTGQYTSGGFDINFDPSTGVGTSQTVSIDFSQLTQFAGDMTADVDQVDGYPQGELKDFTINDAGAIVGSFDNGYNKTLAQIGVAEFANPAGLNKSGETMYTVSNNSGYPKVGPAGSGGKGFISSSKLEMSNVDLAEQFTKMITSQRGFQANSKVITTSDEMLQGLVNIKR